MSKKLLNLKYHVLQKGVEYQTSGYKEPDRPDHAALDIISKAGSSASDKIVTPFPGKVLETRNSIPGNSTKDSAGNYAIVDFGNGFQGRFYHMKAQSVIVTVGQKLTAGAVLGTMGYTGNTVPKGPGGTHLHFEMRKNGAKIDPMPYLMGEKTLGTTPVTAPPAETTKSATVKVGSIVMLKPGCKDYTGRTLRDFLFARKYRVSELKKDRAVITFDGSVVAAVKVGDLILQSSPVVATVKVGSIVMLKPGCTDYTGRTLRAFLFARKYRVSELNKDRAVITYGGSVIAAVKVGDLTLQS